MAVSEYKKIKRYQVGTLKPYVLLLPKDGTLINYSIDNGYCNVALIKTTEVLKIEGLSATYSSEETLNGRFKFSNTLTINIPEGLNNAHFTELSQLLSGDYYTIFETEMGVRFMQSVDLPVEMTYSYQFVNTSVSANLCALSFGSYSNIPTVMLDDSVSVTPTQTFISNECGYNLGRVKKLEMVNFNNCLVVQDSKGLFTEIYTNGGQTFSEIDFDILSFNYTETYEQNVFTQTLTFTIPLDEYKNYWHYNLIEFSNNRYMVRFTTANGNVIMGGFDFGFTPTYTIASTESNTGMDTITITLRHSGDCMSASNVVGTVIDEVDDVSLLAPILQYTDELGNTIGTIVCIDETTGVYTLFEEVTSTGIGTGRYWCMEGYQDTYSNLNIVNTYGLNDDIGYPIKFQSADCSTQQGCRFLEQPPTILNFTAYGESQQYVVNGECDWHLENQPSWLSILPYEGKANTQTTITLTTTAQPTEEGQSSTMRIVASDGNYITIICNYGSYSGWLSPVVFNITGEKQGCFCNIQNYNQIKPIRVTSSTAGYDGSNIIGEELRIWVDENPSYDTERTIQCTVTNGNGESVIVTIHQDHLYKRLVEVEGYICDGNSSYNRMQVYKGYTADNINIPTETYEKGGLIMADDTRCSTVMTEWRDSDETMCNGSDEYKVQVQYQSTNGGQDWVQTGEKRYGELIEQNSPNCNSAYQWIDNGNRLCINGNLYQQLAKTYTPPGGQPQYTGELKIGALIETQSPECVALEESSISWTYTNRNYEPNAEEELCRIVSPGEFTVNFGDGTTETILAGEATTGIGISHRWGYTDVPQTKTVQIYGRVTDVYIYSPQRIDAIDVERGGSLRKLVLNPPDYGNPDGRSVAVSSFDLSNCERLEELIIYKHTGSDGINEFLFPESGTLRILTIDNDSTDECHITPEQMQSIVDSAVAVANENYAGIMSICDCVYIEDGTGIRHHLACEMNTASLEPKKWLFNAPCCNSEGMHKYETRVSENEYACDPNSFNKMQVMTIWESTYTNGAWSAWTQTEYKILGNVVEYNSTDCGYIPELLEDWRLNEDYFICDGYNSYYAEVKYISTNGGVSWSIAQPLETRNSGQLRKQDDEACGWVPPGTYRERWVVVPGEYYCKDGEGEYNPCGFYMLWTPFGFSNGTFNGSGATALPEICDGDRITTLDNTFKDMQKLQLFPVFDVSNVETARGAFMNCISLNNTDEYNLEQYNWANLDDATSMFEGCVSLTSFKASMRSLKNITRMFYGCTNLQSIEFTECGPITDFERWITGTASSLTSIKGINGGGLTGEVDFKGANIYTRNIREFEIYGLNNCSFHVDAFPDINRDSITYIIHNCETDANAHLIFTNDQYNSFVIGELTNYMASHGITWELTG